MVVKHFQDYLLSKILSQWNCTQWAHVTHKSKETEIFYDGKGLRVYCYHFSYPSCHFLMLWVAIIPQILVFFHLSQCKLTRISLPSLYHIFFRFTTYSSGFLSASCCCFNSNSSNLLSCKWYHKLLVLKFLALVPP